MTTDARLEIAAGFASAQGPRADNQDFGGVHLGTPDEQALMGSIAIVADGVSGSKAGRVASELAARTFIDGYLSSNPLKGVAAGATNALRGFNRWLHAQGRSNPDMAGAATTFTGAVLRGREAVVVHVGDSRAWHWREGVLVQLTEDHVLDQPGLSHVLYRAVGIEPELRLDVRHVPLAPYDRLLLTSDGVHKALDEAAIGALLGRRTSPDAAARALVDAALAAGADDNATAVVVDVIRLGDVDQAAMDAEARGLSILPAPAQGEAVDGFKLERMLSDGRYARVFLSHDVADPVVLKFPKPGALSDHGARAAFLRESFIGRRVDSPLVGRTLTLEPGRQTRLYTVQPFYEGRTLHARIADEPFDIPEGVALAIRLSRAVAALHRQGVTHRDIKPDNVILEKSGGLKLIDLGVARLSRMEEFSAAERPGTPGYMAPELLDGAEGDALSDQFALGVTLYRLFCVEYPFGQVEPPARPRFDRPVPPSRRRPDMPAWLEAAILKSLAPDPAQRHRDVEELIEALESGAALAIPPVSRLSWVERHPVLFWQGVSAILLVLFLIALADR